MLRVLEGALAVSEYTDKVDVFSYRSNKLGRIQQQLGDMFAVLSGMLVAAKGKKGQDLIQNRQVSENPELFASIFEVGRRYKVMNPDKMRSSHGKLMYMLMDASMSEVRESMGFSCVRKIVTVEEELRALGAEALLDEEDLDLAVAPVHTGSGASVEDKAGAVARLVDRYGGEGDGGGGGSGAKPQGVARRASSGSSACCSPSRTTSCSLTPTSRPSIKCSDCFGSTSARPRPATSARRSRYRRAATARG